MILGDGVGLLSRILLGDGVELLSEGVTPVHLMSSNGKSDLNITHLCKEP